MGSLSLPIQGAPATRAEADEPLVLIRLPETPSDQPAVEIFWPRVSVGEHLRRFSKFLLLCSPALILYGGLAALILG